MTQEQIRTSSQYEHNDLADSNLTFHPNFRLENSDFEDLFPEINVPEFESPDLP